MTMDNTSETAQAMKWAQLSGEERFRVVEMARKGDVPITEICQTFGVSRQTLYRAMDKADEASRAALEPKRPGRQAPSAESVELKTKDAETQKLQAELASWKTKYEIAKAYLDLVRRYDRGEDLSELEPHSSRGKKKTKQSRKHRTKKRRKRR
jgi:transposase-like protein